MRACGSYGLKRWTNSSTLGPTLNEMERFSPYAARISIVRRFRQYADRANQIDTPLARSSRVAMIEAWIVRRSPFRRSPSRSACSPRDSICGSPRWLTLEHARSCSLRVRGSSRSSRCSRSRAAYSTRHSAMRRRPSAIRASCDTTRESSTSASYRRTQSPRRSASPTEASEPRRFGRHRSPWGPNSYCAENASRSISRAIRANPCRARSRRSGD